MPVPGVAIITGGFIAVAGLRLAWRVAMVLVSIAVLYGTVTFVQVYQASTHDSREPTEAIIVLGAAQYNGVPSPVLQGRLDHAIELFEADIAPFIVVTGGNQPGDEFTEAAAGFRYLRENGVPEASILREEQGTNTWEQLAAATRFLRERGIGSALLVSDDYHALRLEAIAEELGLDAEVSPVDPGLSFTGEMKAFGRETAAVGLGRIIGFRRLVNLDAELNG